MITASSHEALGDIAWIVNQYRAAEIRGAGVILRLGRLADRSDLRANFTRHLRDEGAHAWMWTRVLDELDLPVTDVEDPYQVRLGTKFGLPRTLTELLALTLVSERRGVQTYEEHLALPDVPDVVARTLRGILRDERWHVDWIEEELQHRGETDETVAGALARAEDADRVATAELLRLAGAS